MKWTETVERLTSCLSELKVSDMNGNSMDLDKGFCELQSLTEKIKKQKGTIFLAGNGASASMASHVAADLAKNANIRTEVFSDLALITAVANDISYEDVFSTPLFSRMRQGDLFVAISSSGNSPNIVKAVETARALKGQILTLSAMSPDNKIRKMGDLNIYIPGQSYGLAESGHTAILHHWIDMTLLSSSEVNSPS